MARPIKSGLDYFPHDCDASGDEKIEALRSLYGNDGYAFYFILCERIYRTPDFELDVSDAETRQILSRKVGVTAAQFEKMLATSLKRGCFEQKAYSKRKVLTSNGIKQRGSAILQRREKMRDSYAKRHGVSGEVSDAETREETPNEVHKEGRKKGSKEETINIYPAELVSAFNHWNSLNIIRHEKIAPQMLKAWKKAKKNHYTPEQIRDAMTRYKTVLASPDKFWFDYRWTLDEFLSRQNAIPKFLTDLCFKNFTKGGKSGAAPTAQREIVTNETVNSIADKARKLIGDS
jgi:hypothetical protein